MAHVTYLETQNTGGQEGLEERRRKWWKWERKGNDAFSLGHIDLRCLRNIK